MYKDILDKADAIFLANFLLGYFGSVQDAPALMRLQKIEDLKLKKLWRDSTSFSDDYKLTEEIDCTNPDFGVNVYAIGSAVDGRKKKPPHEVLCDLTSSHINAGGWGCYDFLVTLTREHSTCKFIEEPPKKEFVLGFIKLDAGVLNNAPLVRYLDIGKIDGNFANSTLLCAKTIVPTQPFGSLLRGGKLIALLATSNELRNFYNKRFNRNICVFYTTSLYGTSKTSSQYDQLDKYIKEVGNTTGTFPLRIKDPHKRQIIEWLVDRGISRYEFVFNGTNKADRSHKAITKFARYCLWKYSRKDSNISNLLKKYDLEMNLWENGKTEQKKTYVSTYGFEDWMENQISPEIISMPQHNLENLFAYWKRKVFIKKDWGMRKRLREIDPKVQLRYQLINEQLKDKEFTQVR